MLPPVAPAWRAFCLAGRFLTRWPFGAPADAPPTLYGEAAPYFPLIGLLLGAVLVALAQLAWALGLAGSPAAGVVAVLLLGVWIWSTGALHLDGLADCADAWVGGIGSRERTLVIMKDPHIGAIGVVVLVLALLGKLSALAALLGLAGGAAPGTDGAPVLLWLLLWLPMLARAQILLLALTTPTARPEGLGAVLGAHLPRRAGWVAGVAATLLALAGCALVSVPAALAAGLTAVLVLWAWRRTLCQRLGGYTGDGVGAIVELTETLVLMVAVLAAAAGLR
jgi:adenosylcobinamide-GDP ribazoletransferase